MVDFETQLQPWWFFLADIVFLIFLYQRYIYPVDKSRVNEYGVSQEMLENPAAATEPLENGAPAAAIEDAPKQEAGAAKKSSPAQKKQKSKKAKKND